MKYGPIVAGILRSASDEKSELEELTVAYNLKKYYVVIS